jgi:hypothetical protein
MKKHILIAKSIPRARKTGVGKFEKVELVIHKIIIDMGIAGIIL